MATLYVAGVNAPGPIREHLAGLSKSIDFVKEDVKAGNGYVFFGRNKVTGKDVTLKYYYWGGKAAYHAEPKQLAAINSVNVLPIHDAGLLNDDWAYFLTPTCMHGDLDDLLEKTAIGNHAALDFTNQILSGLSHLHAGRFLHRDLKPSNVYVDEKFVAVIGDFGSVKKLPDGSSSIPASRHSALYRPPESFAKNTYGVTGDIYQAGVILYQLLGGFLSYDAVAYMTQKQREKLKSITDPADESLFVDQCLKELICAGRLLNYATMPPWVPDALKKIIKKACHVDPQKRFQTAAAFMAKLHALRPEVLNWQILEGHPVLVGDTSFRVLNKGEECSVQKRKAAGMWRNDNSFGVDTLHAQVRAVSAVVEGA